MAAGVIPGRRAAAPNWKSKHNELLFYVMADFKRLFTPDFKIGQSDHKWSAPNAGIQNIL